jgi:hypothetical protein
MRTWLSIAVPVLVVVGCKSQPPASGTGPGSDRASSAGSGAAAGPGTTASPACELAGGYRLRYRANGAEGHWLRFKVAGTPPRARVTAMARLLDLDPGPIDTVADPAACTLTLRAHNPQVGDLKIALAVDPTTHAVKGELTRTRAADRNDAATPIAGVHDRGPVALAPGDACFAPAVYAVALDRKHAWTNTAPGDKRSCRRAAEDVEPIYLRVEWLGDALVIDTVEDEPPWNAKLFTTETVARTGPCEVELDQQDSATELHAKLRFAGGALSGTARMKHQIVEGTDEDENIWSCETTGLPVTARRVATPP